MLSIKDSFEIQLEKEKPSALEAFESAIKNSQLSNKLTTESYYPNNSKPYLHFADFIHEQGHRPLSELTHYAEFISQLLSKSALDLVESIPHTKDKEDIVWRWFIEKAESMHLVELEPFIKVVKALVFDRPELVWQFIAYRLENHSLRDLSGWNEVFQHLITTSSWIKPKEYWDVELGRQITMADGTHLFDHIYSSFLKKLSELEVVDYEIYGQVISILCSGDWSKRDLQNLLKLKITDSPFFELAGCWKFIDIVQLQPKNDIDEKPLRDSWEWFVEASEQYSLKELEPWIPYVEQSYDRAVIADWFIEKAKSELPQNLHAWTQVVKLFEMSSDTNGKGISFFRETMQHLPLNELKDWKELLGEVRSTEDARWLYQWLKSKITQSGRTNLEDLKEWQDLIADIVYRADDLMLEKMVSDISEFTDTVDEWKSIDQWVSALLHNLHKLRNADGSKNSPGNESPGRKSYLFLLDNFKKAIGNNSEEAYQFGDLLESFIFEQNKYRFPFRWDESEPVADFEDPRVWVRQLLNDKTSLNKVETWKHLLGRNGNFFRKEIITMFSNASIFDVIGWSEYVSSAVLTLMGGSNFNSTTARINLIVSFVQEIQTHFGNDSVSHFSELFVIFRNYIISLADEEASLLHYATRVKGSLNHMIMNLIDNKPFSLEIPKTAGRLFIWSDGTSTNITNLITTTSYRAWQKANDLQIPTAPILNARSIDETLDVQEIFHGTRLVDTRMVGKKVDELNPDVERYFNEEISCQQTRIRETLTNHGINYTTTEMEAHDRNHNYLIEFIERDYFDYHGGWESINTIPYNQSKFTTDSSIIDLTQPYNQKTAPWILIMRIIDWDHAYLEEDKDSIDKRFYMNHDGRGYEVVMG